MTLAAPSRARALVGGFAGARILVAGDVMLDQFVFGGVTRISPEAPVPVVQFEHEHVRLGGAANVAANVRALGGQVHLVGVVGHDEPAAMLREALAAIGVSGDAIVATDDRPTTRKVRLVTTRNQQVARIDYECDRELTGSTERAVAERAAELVADADVVVVSDYLKGVVTRRVASRLIDAAADRGIPLLVDPKIPHVDCYRGATLVTPNHHEAETGASMRIRSDDEAREAARAFQARAGCESVLVTRGEHGMWLLEGRWPYRPRAGDPAPPIVRVSETGFAVRAREVSDVTGAGDTVIATIAAALAAGASLPEAADLANYAAGVSVGKFGSATVSPDELLAALG